MTLYYYLKSTAEFYRQ